MKPVRTFDVNEEQHAYILAERDAILLLALSSGTIPSEYPSVRSLFHTRIVEASIHFAINARRFLEVTGLRPEIKQVLRPIQSGSDTIEFETSLWEALNGILHSRCLNTSSHKSPIEGFPLGDTEWAAVLVFETDRRPRTFIDTYSMAWAFLELDSSGSSA